MNTTRTRTRGSFRFPKLDSVGSAFMLVVGFAGVCLVAVSTVASFFGA